MCTDKAYTLAVHACALARHTCWLCMGVRKHHSTDVYAGLACMGTAGGKAVHRAPCPLFHFCFLFASVLASVLLLSAPFASIALLLSPPGGWGAHTLWDSLRPAGACEEGRAASLPVFCIGPCL